MTIAIEVDHNKAYIVDGKLSSEAYHELKKALGYQPENFEWIKKGVIENKVRDATRGMKNADAIEATRERIGNGLKNWDGTVTDVCYDKARCRCHTKKAYTHFSSGLLPKAREFFDSYGIDYTLKDIRTHAEKRQVGLKMSSDFEARDYQAQARDKACNKQRGIIKCATGGGKTAIASSIIAELGVVPFIFYVTSKDLLKQAKAELERFVLKDGKPLEVGMVGGGHKDIKDVTVMTVQTAIRALDAKYEAFDEEDRSKDKTDITDIKKQLKDYIRSAKGIMCDEVQHWAARTCQVIADSSESAHFRYGLSATPYREKGDDILIEACFGGMISNISASFLIDRGFLVQPDIYFIKVDNISSSRYSTYQNIYKQGIVENQLRNKWISDLATRFYDEGHYPLILAKTIAHGKLLKSLIPGSEFMHGSVSTKKRTEYLARMKQRDTGVTIATSIFDEGVDVKPLDVLLLAGSGKSSTRALQRVGRIIRPYPNVENNVKKKAIAIDFDDRGKYVEDHSKARRAIYETEPRFNIKDMSL